MAEPTAMTEELLVQAYCDGELPATQAAALEQRLASEPALRVAVASHARLARALREFDPVLAEPVPLPLLRTVARPARWPRAWLTSAAAFLAGLAVGLVVALQWPGTGTAAPGMRRALPAEAALAHAVYTRERRHAVEVKADELQHLNTWLSNRLAHEVVAPQLRDAGFELVGGRLLADAGRPAAQFMYENADKVRFTLFVRAHDEMPASTAPAYLQSGEFAVIYWTDGSLAYAWTGPAERETLTRLATLTRTAAGGR